MTRTVLCTSAEMRLSCVAPGPTLVAVAHEDILEGYISREQARAVYGYDED